MMSYDESLAPQSTHIIQPSPSRHLSGIKSNCWSMSILSSPLALRLPIDSGLYK